ncbi:hypothetical protein OEZ49_17990 [Ruegeria sp. WL0004]|uniref:Uncharacterized protein n=1 Tax=Ruegeria marisflavi TaxID=2984152 RepID=A0ABT2WUT1_9RHOB|nr:hypothetical protein [Ruegeria sp. WL0004]MCU9839669.1 hypothetical protein [Ruegeria sp. WL0004]
MQTSYTLDAWPPHGHPDNQDTHPQEIWRCPERGYRLIVPTKVAHNKFTSAPVLISIQAPRIGREGNDTGFWFTVSAAPSKGALFLRLRIFLTRNKDSDWRGRIIPDAILREQRIPSDLFSILKALPQDFTHLLDWTVEDLLDEAKALAEHHGRQHAILHPNHHISQ